MLRYLMLMTVLILGACADKKTKSESSSSPVDKIVSVEIFTSNAIYLEQDPFVRIQSTEWLWNETFTNDGEEFEYEHDFDVSNFRVKYVATYWDTNNNSLYIATLKKTNGIVFELDQSKSEESNWATRWNIDPYRKQETNRSILQYVGNISPLSRVYISLTNTDLQFIKTLKLITNTEILYPFYKNYRAYFTNKDGFLFGHLDTSETEEFSGGEIHYTNLSSDDSKSSDEVIIDENSGEVIPICELYEYGEHLFYKDF